MRSVAIFREPAPVVIEDEGRRQLDHEEHHDANGSEHAEGLYGKVEVQGLYSTKK